MRYVADDGEVSHTLHVLGYGACEMDSSRLCVTCKDTLHDDQNQDHDCRYILEE